MAKGTNNKMNYAFYAAALALEHIHEMHKWQQFKYSFVYIQIRSTKKCFASEVTAETMLRYVALVIDEQISQKNLK